MATINIKESQLFELCRNCLMDLKILNVKEKAHGEFEADELIAKLTRILKLSPAPLPAVTPSDPKSIAFSLFSAWFVVKLTGQLGSGFKMWTEINKASTLSASYQSNVKTYLTKAGIVLIEKEFLVDYYIHPQDHFHCPILTVESESQENGSFFDLSKLLLVNSPRRVYVANLLTANFKDALSKIKNMLNESQASGAIDTSDQIVIVLYKKIGKKVKLHIYDYDQYRHV